MPMEEDNDFYSQTIESDIESATFVDNNPFLKRFDEIENDKI